MFSNMGRKRMIGIAAVAALVLCSVVFSLAEVLMPSADGKPAKKDKLVVYTSHADEGYVMVQPPKTTQSYSSSVFHLNFFSGTASAPIALAISSA